MKDSLDGHKIQKIKAPYKISVCLCVCVCVSLSLSHTHRHTHTHTHKHTHTASLTQKLSADLSTENLD